MTRPTDGPDDLSPLKVYGNYQIIKRIFRYFLALIMVGLVAGLFILLSHGDWKPALYTGGAILFIVASYVFVLRDKFEIATIIVAIIMIALITYLSTSGLGIHALPVLGFPAILIVASLVIRKRTLTLLVIFEVICIAWLVFGEIYGLYKPSTLVKSVPGDFFTVALAVIGTTIMVRLLTESLFQSNLEAEKELNEKKQAEERLAHDALHDSLTNLPNRALFHDRLTQRFEFAKRHPENLFAVLFLDLDRFKVVNDSLGHNIGDQMLVETAHRLSRCLRPDDTVARLGGDEFGILLNDFREIGNAVHIAERVQAELTATSMIKGYNRVTTVSIGITVFSSRYQNPNEMLRDADSAMYRAKSKGGAHYAIFDDSMHASAMKELELEADLKHAIENKEWQIHYQPIVTLPDKNILSMEALLRWDHPRHGLMQPLDFIHVAEETGLINQIGDYVLLTACQQVKEWRTKAHPNLVASINLSARQFQSRELVDTLARILSETGLEGNALQVEITETTAMHDLAYSVKVLNDLVKMGIQIALDDFGTGYSSLGYLYQFPIHVIKIDKGLIGTISSNQSSESITRAIISLAHALDLQVIAEGVETKEQFSLLNSYGCDQIQGYFISHPQPASQIVKLL